MTTGKKIKFLLYKSINFSYFEINLFDRFQFFKNHIHNLFFKNVLKTAVRQFEIKDTFVISLRYRVDRRSHVCSLFSYVGLNFKFYEGKYVNDVETLKQYFTDQSIKCLSHGALGCALSHIQLWYRIAESEEGLYLVFEDDIKFSNSYMENLKSLSRNYPSNCDIFYLGSRNNRLRDILYFTDDNYARSFNPRMGAFAYAITPQGAKKILAYLLPIDLICGGIDTALGMLVRSRVVNAYQFYPTQVFHDNTLLSNIFNPSVPDKKLHATAISDWPLHLRVDKF